MHKIPETIRPLTKTTQLQNRCKLLITHRLLQIYGNLDGNINLTRNTSRQKWGHRLFVNFTHKMSHANDLINRHNKCYSHSRFAKVGDTNDFIEDILVIVRIGNG